MKQFYEIGPKKDMAHFFAEDQLGSNFHYYLSLPEDLVQCRLKIKSDLILSGLPYFVSAFNFLGADLDYAEFQSHEGKKKIKGDEIHFILPFNIALTGERVALNLLQRSSAISTYTQEVVKQAAEKKIKILDTRKTTPGLRALEKYAVLLGGGYNHRMGQTDCFMIKDNHKSFFGSLTLAHKFFSEQKAFYNSLIAEVHSLEELREAISLNIAHVMLDNFSLNDLNKAIALKPSTMTFEISGGINDKNIHEYLLEGIDVISLGALTHSAPHVDLSLKFGEKVCK